MKTPHQPFEDAQQLAKEHPDSFFALSSEVLALVAPGKQVKVCTGDERFWVSVERVEGNMVIGVIDNDLQNTHKNGLVADDCIRFELHHIYAIWLDGDEHIN